VGLCSIGKYTQFLKVNGCVGKLVFATYADAQREVGRLTRNGHHRPDQGVLAPYHCGACLGYHIGHSS
jgi:hypothetical protein